MTIVSFKSKYIAVAIAAAIVVSLAVGVGHDLREPRAARALLDSATADARDRVMGELNLRANESARHVAELVADGVLRGDRDACSPRELESFKRDETLLGMRVRDTAGVELYSWHRDRRQRRQHHAQRHRAGARRRAGHARHA